MGDNFTLWISHLVFGLLQGLTEVLPISSSAHTAIGQAIWASFASQSHVTFSTSVFFHVGTFLAILLLYRRDVFSLWHSTMHTIIQRSLKWQKGATKAHPLGQQTPFYMLMSLAATGVLGLSLERTAGDVFRQPLWAAGFLTINGLCLLTVSWYTKRHSIVTRDIASLEWWHYLVIGAAQGVAAIPGLSRFGLTLIAGLLCGLGWYQALKLSFLLSLPMVLAAAGLEFYFVRTNLTLEAILPTIIGIVLASLGAWVAIRVIRREGLHAQQALSNFGLYCMAAGPLYFLYIYHLGL